jgi:acetyl-CoA carboxylase carboxyltransferase component
VDTLHTAITTALPGLVVRHLVTEGAEVRKGDRLLVTETMKCEQTHVAPHDGMVSLNCALGEVIEAGSVVATVTEAQQPAAQTARVRGPRPLGPRAVLDKVCGPLADRSLHPMAQTGTFLELDLEQSEQVLACIDPGDRLVPLDGADANESGVTVGLITHVLEGHPDGVSRVWIGGDPSRSMGAVAEAECRRIIAAFDLAEELRIPVEWVALSAGARIAWDSGTENMDWCAAVVARIVTFTQRGGQVVIIVNGINVGAQSYWNAEATMLGHHKGMLVMLKDQAMVLTGKGALALSGGGTFATDAAIGGYDEVMGPNGQAHHLAENIIDAYRMVFAHHTLCTRRSDQSAAIVNSHDSVERDLTKDPYNEPEPFDTVGEILLAESHSDRKQAFAIRPVLDSLVDRDAPVLERWTDMADAEGAVVWDSRIGGVPTTVIGIESRPYQSTTGRWLSGGVLHPEGSRKIAKALNAASGNRPAVVMANLAGFDGSATSMLGRQLEFGAEIARAVTNFEGPLVVVVLGRFHGGAYVVFSKALNRNVKILALDGTYVSVIGGDAAAGVVFASELKKRIAARLEADPEADADLVHRQERDLLARKFDQVHDVRRAAAVGSIDEVIQPSRIRPEVARLIGAELPEQVSQLTVAGLLPAQQSVDSQSPVA